MKEFQGEHLYIHHLDSTTEILIHLLNHVFTQMFIPLVIFLPKAFHSRFQISVQSPINTPACILLTSI